MRFVFLANFLISNYDQLGIDSIGVSWNQQFDLINPRPNLLLYFEDNGVLGSATCTDSISQNVDIGQYGLLGLVAKDMTVYYAHMMETRAVINAVAWSSTQSSSFVFGGSAIDLGNSTTLQSGMLVTGFVDGSDDSL